MRTLGIETSSSRGSVALLDAGTLVGRAEHRQPSSHAELILPLIDRLLAEASWPRASLDRIVVGIGPGSFTGLRVGLALAQGIALGLDCPLIGIGSLRAMAAATPETRPSLRCPVLDARRDELFIALYERDVELVAPRAVPRAELRERLLEMAAGRSFVVIGEDSPPLEGLPSYRSADTDLPDAAWTARLGERTEPDGLPVEPLYVREAGATLPTLPPSPLG